jgi:hypothetical protein
MKAIEFGDFDFDTEKGLFDALHKNQNTIIGLKKSVQYKSFEKGSCQVITPKVLESVKGLENTKDGFIYPVISTTNFLDSHKDVHFDGCFNKTIKDQQGKVKYILDHNLNYDSVIAWQKDVKMLKRKIDWSVVGKSYEGETEALIFEIDKEKIRRKDVLLDIENKVEDFENSIRMVYFKIVLGVNSDAKEHKKERAYYEKKINLIANKDEVSEDGYFWGVEELGIRKEGSLVVAGGSNSATSIYEAVNVGTSKEEREETKQQAWYY